MRVIGLGDNVVDKYHHLQTMFPGGNALNFAVYAKMLGVDASYCGVFGNDGVGDHIKSVMNELDIDISSCVTRDGENGYAEVNLVDGDRVFFGGNKGGVSKSEPLILSDELVEYLNEFELIHSSCYSHLEEEIKKLKDRKGILTFDFSNRIEQDYLEKVCPNVDVAFFSAGDLETKEEIDGLLQQAIDLGSVLAIASMGTRGQRVYDGKAFYSGKVKLVEPVDTLGAGDSFFTQFILSIVEKGWRRGEGVGKEVVEQAFDLAADYSAKTCMVYGAFGHGAKF
jgi:sugar/nucleoside kinase (ribokinase family)